MLDAIRDEIDATTKRVQNTARDNAPEVTGHLVDRFQHFIKSNGMRGVVYNDADYARRIELGFQDTDSLGREYNQRGQYPLTRAFEEETKDFDKRVKRRMS